MSMKKIRVYVNIWEYVLGHTVGYVIHPEKKNAKSKVIY